MSPEQRNWRRLAVFTGCRSVGSTVVLVNAHRTPGAEGSLYLAAAVRQDRRA
jgi:hypothetical protein